MEKHHAVSCLYPTFKLFFAGFQMLIDRYSMADRYGNGNLKVTGIIYRRRNTGQDVLQFPFSARMAQ